MARRNTPQVTGISPKEGPPGTQIIIRGENLGISANDVIGKYTRSSYTVLEQIILPK